MTTPKRGTGPRTPNLGDGGLKSLSTLVGEHGQRLDGHEGRLEGHDGRLDGHEAVLTAHHDRLSALEKAVPDATDGDGAADGG